MLVPEAQIPQDRIISPRMLVRRERLLTTSGHVLISQGSHVEPSDVVAEVQQSGPVQVVAAAKALGVAPQKLLEHLLVQVGDMVSVGQVLAQRGRGPLRRSVVSPLEGTLALMDEHGHLLVQGAPQRQQVQALMRGEVVNVMPGRGVVIEGQAALVQGVWGNGLQNPGLLRLMVSQPNQSASPSLINAGVRGTILIVGATTDQTGLQNARVAQVRGLIAGSLDGSLLALAQQMPYPILLTEGFGHLPIGYNAFRLLESLDGRDAVLSARYVVRYGRTRPELLVPLSGSGHPASPPGPLVAGDRVRLLSTPYLGQMGVVQQGSSNSHTMPNEIQLSVCEVQLELGGTVMVPYTNLERLLQ